MKTDNTSAPARAYAIPTYLEGPGLTPGPSSVDAGGAADKAENRGLLLDAIGKMMRGDAVGMITSSEQASERGDALGRATAAGVAGLGYVALDRPERALKRATWALGFAPERERPLLHLVRAAAYASIGCRTAATSEVQMAAAAAATEGRPLDVRACIDSQPHLGLFGGSPAGQRVMSLLERAIDAKAR